MIDYAALEAVYVVLEEGSFERAAARLNVSPSAVSHRIKNAEDKIGSPLILRGTPCLPTTAGQRVHRHMERVHLLEQDLGANLPGVATNRSPHRRAKARIVVNADSLSTWCVPALARFTNSTGCLMDVVIEDQDFALDLLSKGETDAAITAASEPATGCKTFYLGSLRYHATASKEFFETYFSDGVTENTLSTAPSLTFNRKDSLQRKWSDEVFGRPIVQPTHWVPSSTAFVDAALCGMGWGMNPEHLVSEHLKSGKLVELLPGRTIETPLYWQINRISEELLSDLTACVRETARQVLRQPSEP